MLEPLMLTRFTEARVTVLSLPPIVMDSIAWVEVSLTSEPKITTLGNALGNGDNNVRIYDSLSASGDALCRFLCVV